MSGDLPVASGLFASLRMTDLRCQTTMTKRGSRMASRLPHWWGQIGLAALLAALTLAAPALALEVPSPPRQWVTDRAGILSEPDRAALNEKLRSFETRSGAQFLIYIFPALENESLEDFTIRAAEKWKVGQAKYDNGLILFVFVAEKKLRFEVGYGLEGTMTDAMSSRILRQIITPAFQRGDYAGGLNAAADAVINLIEKNESPVPVAERAGTGSNAAFSMSDLIPIFFFILIFVFIIGPMLRRGGFGGCGGCFLPIIPFGGGGITFGGGGGGGGFGGFSGGGGSFGGGGASGGW